MLRKPLRLQKNREFSYIYRKGTRSRGRYLTLYALRGSREMKIGVSISKKAGNAAVRNLCRRRLHHIFRELLPTIRINKYIVVANDSIAEATYPELRADVIAILAKMNAGPKGE